jgi:leader peptidase (prepilin peptidase)/N-methyltransferase
LLAIAATFFLLVALIDLKHRLVPDVLIYPAGIVALLLHLLLPGGQFLAALIGGAFGFFTFLLTALLRPKGLGGGDVKLAAVIGLTTGFPEMLWALAVGIVSGGLAALALVLVARREAQSTIPYAPFLCLGAIVALLYNPLPLFFPS